MSNQETNMLDELTAALDQSMEQIYAGLDGKELSVETLAAALAQLCPDVSALELEQDCQSLLDGIHRGTEFAQNLLDMQEEELAKVFPDQIRNALGQMNPEQQHQYLIMLYQYLCQSAGKNISREEAITVANDSTEVLFRKICDLGQYTQAELTNETAEIFHETLQKAAIKPLPEGADRYTQEERMWVLSAAMYAQARENTPEKVPASLIGEVVGMSSSSAQAFRTKLLSEVIPAAVGVLSVIAVGTLVFLGVKALMGCSLFVSIMTWMTARVKPHILAALCAAYLLEPVTIAASEIYDTAYTATAAFTTRFLRDEARDIYNRNHPVQMPGEGLAHTDDPVQSIPPMEYEGEGYVREDDTITGNPVVTECY